MRRVILRSKIHGAWLTGARLEYEGSIGLDRNLMRKANLLPGEQVHVLNLNNGSRLVTYVIAAAAGSGEVQLNGAAARLGVVGDRVIILAYAECTPAEARRLRPRIVRVNRKNQPLNERG